LKTGRKRDGKSSNPIANIAKHNSIWGDDLCIVNVQVETGDAMANVKEKPIWKFKVTGQQETSTKSQVTARGITCIVDEPIQRGGTDLGPMPVEYVFVGLAGCTHVISNKLAAANGIKFSDMDIGIDITMDSHGTRLINPIDIPFPDVTVNITASYDGPREGAAEVVRQLRHHCAVSKMLQESGTRVTENWVLNGEQIGAG
jgi:uncharacterized OsmC-like protein